MQVGVGDQQPFVQVLEQTQRHELLLLGLALVVHIGQGRQQANRAARTVPLHHHQGGLEPVPSCEARHPQFQLPPSVVTDGQRTDGLGQGPSVVGVDLLVPRQGGPVLVLMAREAAPSRRREAVVSEQVPIGHAQAGAVQGPFPPL